MRNLKIISILIVSMTITVAAEAQVFDVDNSVDAKYTPPEGSIFETKEKSKSNRGGGSDFKNTIMINITPVTRGAIALEYGRILSNNFVLTGAGGVTIFHDYIKQVGLNLYGEDPFISEDVFSDGLGLFWKGEAQVYFNGAYDSDFVTFGLRNFRYNLIYKPGQGNFSSLASDPIYERFNTNFKESNLDFFIGYGSSYILSANLIAEFSFSIGLRSTKSSSFEIETVQFQNTSSIYSDTQYATQLVQTEYRAILPAILMTFKLGFGFGN